MARQVIYWTSQRFFSYEYSTFTYPEAITKQLKKPIFAIESAYDVDEDNLSNSALMQAEVRFSPRNGMPGLGLLELIPEQDIMDLADATDKNADGISGRVNYEFVPIKAANGDTNLVSLGRFG